VVDVSETQPGDAEATDGPDTAELAESGGVGISAGAPSTFEPEEDPEAAEPDGDR